MQGVRWSGKIALAAVVLTVAGWATSQKLLGMPPGQFWALIVGYLAVTEGLWLMWEKRALDRVARLARQGLQRLTGHEAAPRQMTPWCLKGGRPRPSDMAAGFDAPREYFTGILATLLSTHTLPRVHVLAGMPGTGRSALLLRLGQALAQKDHVVLRALPTPRLDIVEAVLSEADHGRLTYLLLDDLDAHPQADELLYAILRSGRPLVVVATALGHDHVDRDRDLLEALEPADLLASATWHHIQVTPNDLGALVTKLGALGRLERQQVSGDAGSTYLRALDHLQGEEGPRHLWDTPEEAGLPAATLVAVALAGAAEVTLPQRLFQDLVAPTRPVQWQKAGVVALEWLLAWPPHQLVCLALLERHGLQDPALGQALNSLLARAMQSAPALAPRLLCGLSRVPQLRDLAAAAAQSHRAAVLAASLPPALRALWRHAWESLDLPPEPNWFQDDSAPARAALAADRLRQGDHEAALGIYRALADDPVYGDLARFNTALCLAHLQRLEEAEEELATRRQPIPGTAFLRGVIAEMRGELMAALDWYEKSRKADEVALPATRRLAVTYLRSGAPRAALPLFESMLSYTPLRADLYGGLAAAHLHAGTTQRAAAQSARAIQAGVEPGVARRAVAKAFRDVNAFERMAHELEAAVLYDQDDAEAWDELAHACHWQGRFTREEQCLQHLERCQPGATDLRLRQARCCRDLGRPVEALAMLRELVRLPQTPVAGLLLTAEVAGACGEKKLQRELAEEALRRADDSGWAHFWWADSQPLEAEGVADSYRRAVRLLEALHARGLTPRLSARLWQAVYVAATRLEDEPLAERALRLARQEALVCKAIGSEIESITTRRSVPADVFLDENTGAPPPSTAAPGTVTSPSAAPRPASGFHHDSHRPQTLPNRLHRGQGA